MAPKRKRDSDLPRASKKISTAAVNPDANSQVIDGLTGIRASPDSEIPKAKKENAKAAAEDGEFVLDPEAEVNVEEDFVQVADAAARPPAVNSSYLPLPWKAFREALLTTIWACLNTYLRTSNPPVFSSRTCRIASIEEHCHPLVNPNEPEHPTKNRPDKEKPYDKRLGAKWVEELGLANARDIVKMIKWNDKYGIKFMRLSSEMFPFASHTKYGYKLAPFASETLAEAGKVIAQLGHRVSCHPGQFTQLGSPRKEVVENAYRDLEFHDELLSLLKLPEQSDRDAVLILHMGGTFGSKSETLDRFRTNYAKLSPSIKQRLVLENDDMCWSVHDLLPICKELSIPICLDWHHHNIIFDSSQVREGTEDVSKIAAEIRELWDRKQITQKMHYSESCPDAITGMQRRKHSPRVATLPPCAPDMDLMIEAKDKEQAVFELMRTFKLPGYEKLNPIIPYSRTDENTKPIRKKDAPAPEITVQDEEVGMGGHENRVYWPPGMEEWLRPKKREVKPKDESKKPKTPIKSKTTVKQEPDAEINAEPISEVKVSNSKKKAKKAKAAKVLTPSTSDNDTEDVKMENSPILSRRRSNRVQKVNYQENDESE